MANLKADLLNELRNQKYYAETELLRLAQDPNIKYINKINSICNELGIISLLNQKIALADAFFQNPEQVNPVENIPQESIRDIPQEPIKEIPKQQKQPVEAKPVKEQPVEEKPVEEKPVVNKPVAGQSHAE